MDNFDFLLEFIPPQYLDMLRSIDTIFYAYAALGLMAIVPIYIGSFRGIKFVHKELEDGEEEEEYFSLDDAKMFPVIGSASLFGLYCVFKFFDKDMINMIVTGYFTFMSVGTSFVVLLDFCRFVCSF
jgi:minor histocompatibility antigen H13